MPSVDGVDVLRWGKPGSALPDTIRSYIHPDQIPMAFREALLDETRDIIYEIKADAPSRRDRDPWIRDAFDIAGAIVTLHMHDLEDLDDE